MYINLACERSSQEFGPRGSADWYQPEAAASTPPRMRGPLPRHFGHAFIKDAERYIRGEAGYFWEQGVIGGIVEYTRDEIVDVRGTIYLSCLAWHY